MKTGQPGRAHERNISVKSRDARRARDRSESHWNSRLPEHGWEDGNHE